MEKPGSVVILIFLRDCSIFLNRGCDSRQMVGEFQMLPDLLNNPFMFMKMLRKLQDIFSEVENMDANS